MNFLKKLKKTKPDQSIINGSISFDNVSYTYEDTNIKQFKTFLLQCGNLAILGKTGSWQVNYLSLISRLYDVTEGQIKIDDNEIQHTKPFDLRNSIGIVPQDAFIFQPRLRSNIKFGKRCKHVMKWTAAAKNAVVHEHHGFNKQYDTFWGKRNNIIRGQNRGFP
jgi:ATP-binding cassette subfamily B protein